MRKSPTRQARRAVFILLAIIGPALCSQTRPGGQSHSAAELYRQASERFVAAQYEQAIVLLQRSLAINPKQLRPTKLLGICYQLVSNFEEARRAFRKAIEIDSKDAEAWYLLGRVDYAENFFVEAKRSLEVARRLDGRDVRVRECLALTLEAMGDIHGAMEEFRAAITENARSAKPSATPYLNYGVLLHKLNRLEESAAQLRKAIETNPKDWQAYLELGKLLYTRGELEASAEQLSLSLAQGTSDAEQSKRVRRLLGQVYSRLGREEEARRVLALAEEP